MEGRASSPPLPGIVPGSRSRQTAAAAPESAPGTRPVAGGLEARPPFAQNHAMTNAERATTFRHLHAPGEFLILPNAWDAGSARLIESCGAPAIATSSAAVAWANGYPDGDALPPH